MRYKENMQVTFQTQRMVAEQTANQTIIKARGEANRKLQQARANAKITEQTVKPIVTMDERKSSSEFRRESSTPLQEQTAMTAPAASGKP